VKLADPEDNTAEVEKRRTEESWKAVERPPWAECVLREDDRGFDVLCHSGNLLVEFRADAIMVPDSPAYREAAFAFMDNVRTLAQA